MSLPKLTKRGSLYLSLVISHCSNFQNCFFGIPLIILSKICADFQIFLKVITSFQYLRCLTPISTTAQLYQNNYLKPLLTVNYLIFLNYYFHRLTILLYFRVLMKLNWSDALETLKLASSKKLWKIIFVLEQGFPQAFCSAIDFLCGHWATRLRNCPIWRHIAAKTNSWVVRGCCKTLPTHYDTSKFIILLSLWKDFPFFLAND